MTDKHKVYFHKLGTKQSQDELIIGDKFPRRYLSGYVTEDQRYLVVSAANATNGNELYIKDLKNKTDFIPIVTGFDSNVGLLIQMEIHCSCILIKMRLICVW